MEKKIGSLKSKIGAYFPYQEFLDSSGRLTKIDFSKSEYTIIDFWFKSCLPCIEEMKKFEKVMAGKQVSIISVSINNFQEWKKSPNDSTPQYRFLQRKVQNWNHFTMKSDDNPKLNNLFLVDVYQKLIDDLDVTFYPAYFVVDKSGKIIDRPVSAVGYIHNL